LFRTKMYDEATHTGLLFLAILPDAKARQQIYRMAEVIKRAHGLRGQLTARDRLHATLFPLTGLPEAAVQKVCGIITETRAEPFEVSFDCTTSFRGGRGSRPFVLTGDDGLRRLKSFRRSLAVAFKARGLGFLARRDFTPHVTLLFDDRAVEEHPADPVRWTVSEVVLIHSLGGHQHLARWPLDV
jgi:RNA 2',3'-cyclic 3'-phosphodiesterase